MKSLGLKVMTRGYVTWLVFVFASRVAFGWSAHHWITRTAAGPILSDSPSVVYEPLEAALKRGLSRVTARTREALDQELRIRKQWAFPTKLGETPGARVPALSVLSTYADEPDWGLDQNLFEPDQYPELWGSEIPYLGGRKGLKSQGFRHLFFPGRWDWSQPLSSLQVPMHPLGAGPDRAALFYGLAQDFFQHGSPYWGYRFLAWTLHYLEDLFQPYHTRQLPSKRFLRLGWRGWLPGLDIGATAEQVGYYHLSYEWWIENAMQLSDSPLGAALASDAMAPPLESGIREMVLDHIVGFSSSRAAEIARLSLEVFPAFHPTAGQLAETTVGTDAWRDRVGKPPLAAELTRRTTEIFMEMGRVIRRLVVSAIPRPH